MTIMNPIEEKYMSRNYPSDWKSRTKTQYDEKMIRMLTKVDNKYKECMSRRKHIVLLDIHEIPAASHEQKINIEKKEKTEKKIESTVQCMAITKGNCQCKNKAKPGTEFCGKHSK